MPQTHKVLGQVNPSATSLTSLYTVPSATQAIGSTLTICNLASTAATYRVAVRPAGATIANQHYLAYDATVGANDTVVLTLGLTAGATDVVSVYASTGNVSFALYGVEIT